MEKFRSWLFTPIGALVYFGVGYALVALVALGPALASKGDALVQIPYQYSTERLLAQTPSQSQVVQPPIAATGTTVSTTGDVNSSTKISVGTIAGETLNAVLALFAVPIGGFLSMILFRVLKGVGVNVSASQEALLQQSVNRAVVLFGNNAPKLLDGKISVNVKNGVITNAVKYVQDHRADTLKALGVDPGSPEAVQAITARAETALADPSVPTPEVANTNAPAAASPIDPATLEQAVRNVLLDLKARTTAPAAA